MCVYCVLVCHVSLLCCVLQKKIATLTTKAEALETERDALKEAHKLSEEKVFIILCRVVFYMKL